MKKPSEVIFPFDSPAIQKNELSPRFNNDCTRLDCDSFLFDVDYIHLDDDYFLHDDDYIHLDNIHTAKERGSFVSDDDGIHFDDDDILSDEAAFCLL